MWKCVSWLKMMYCHAGFLLFLKRSTFFFSRRHFTFRNLFGKPFVSFLVTSRGFRCVGRESAARPPRELSPPLLPGPRKTDHPSSSCLPSSILSSTAPTIIICRIPFSAAQNIQKYIFKRNKNISFRQAFEEMHHGNDEPWHMWMAKTETVTVMENVFKNVIAVYEISQQKWIL